MAVAASSASFSAMLPYKHAMATAAPDSGCRLPHAGARAGSGQRGGRVGVLPSPMPATCCTLRLVAADALLWPPCVPGTLSRPLWHCLCKPGCPLCLDLNVVFGAGRVRLGGQTWQRRAPPPYPPP